MDAVTNSISHTWNGREMLPVLFTPIFQSPNILENYTVYPNIKEKVNLYFAGAPAMMLRKYTGCGFTATGGLQISDRQLEVHRVKINQEMCEDQFEGTFLAETFRAGVEINDLSGTEVYNVWLKRVLEGLKNDTFRISWFGDDVNANADWNQFDGFFRIMTDTVAVTKLDLNSSPTYAAGNVLAAEGAAAAFKTMLTSAPAVYRQPAIRQRLRFLCLRFGVPELL